GTADAAHSGVDMHNQWDDNKVQFNIIKDNSIGVFANCSGPLASVIQKNLIQANNVQCTPTACASEGAGIYVDSSVNLQILDNDINVGNNAFVKASVGVRLIDDGYGFPANSDIHINGNSFDLTQVPVAVSRDPGGNGSDSDTVLDATANWWSVATGIPARIDTTDGAVDYTPWLVSSTDIGGDPC